MDIVTPKYTADELEQYFQNTEEDYKKVKKDNYHIAWFWLNIMRIIICLIIFSILINYYDSFIDFYKKYLKIPFKGSYSVTLLLNFFLLFIARIFFYLGSFIVTKIVLRLLKYRWIKQNKWKSSCINELEKMKQMNNCISLLRRIEEIAQLPKHVIDLSDVYKEKNRIVFKIKENGYIEERIVSLENRIIDEICKPDCLDFSLIDIEIEKLMEDVAIK